jgi:hypothetical protein
LSPALKHHSLLFSPIPFPLKSPLVLISFDFGCLEQCASEGGNPKRGREIRDAILALDDEFEMMGQRWEESVFSLLQKRRKMHMWNWPLSCEELKRMDTSCGGLERSFSRASGGFNEISLGEITESALEIEIGHGEDGAEDRDKDEDDERVGEKTRPFEGFVRMAERQIIDQYSDQYSSSIQHSDDVVGEDVDDEGREEERDKVEEMDARLDSKNIQFSALHVAECVRHVLGHLVRLKHHLLHCSSLTSTSANGVSKLHARCDELPFLNAMKMAGIRLPVVNAVQKRLRNELGFTFYDEFERRRGRSRAEEGQGERIHGKEGQELVDEDEDWNALLKYLTKRGPKLKFPYVRESSCNLCDLVSLVEDGNKREHVPRKRRKKS